MYNVASDIIVITLFIVIRLVYIENHLRILFVASLLQILFSEWCRRLVNTKSRYGYGYLLHETLIIIGLPLGATAPLSLSPSLLFVLQMSTGGGKVAHWFDSTIHAREWLATTTNMRVLDHVSNMSIQTVHAVSLLICGWFSLYIFITRSACIHLVVKCNAVWRSAVHCSATVLGSAVQCKTAGQCGAM